MLQPVYDFLGYCLNEIKYVNSQKENTYIGISIPRDFYNDEMKQYSLIIRVTTDCSEEESYFIFQAIFKINDYKWFSGLEANEKRAVFFSFVFPFIREKILSITSDSNPGLFIPTLDVRTINFEKELKLVKSFENVK